MTLESILIWLPKKLLLLQSRDKSGMVHFGILTFLQQLLFPQQFVKMELTIAASDGVGEGGFEVEDGGANLLGAPLKGRSISTNSRS